MSGSRNYLRRQVLRHCRWPQALVSLSRAGASGEAGQLLDELAQQDVAAAEAFNEFAWLGIARSGAASLVTCPGAPAQRLRYWLNR